MNSKDSSSSKAKAVDGPRFKKPLSVRIISFGHKDGPAPQANMVFDVRFLKNPYWVLELRPLTGLDGAVKEYVLAQELAKDLIDSVLNLLGNVLPRFEELEIEELSIAFGCTGGQHRSVAIAELVADKLAKAWPHYSVVIEHRQLAVKAGKNSASRQEVGDVDALEGPAKTCNLKIGEGS